MNIQIWMDRREVAGGGGVWDELIGCVGDVTSGGTECCRRASLADWLEGR